MVFTKETSGKFQILSIAKSVEIFNNRPQMYAVEWKDDEEAFIRGTNQTANIRTQAQK